jgi:hypothetical protein
MSKLGSQVLATVSLAACRTCGFDVENQLGLLGIRRLALDLH